jgi:hypothetical protein
MGSALPGRDVFGCAATPDIAYGEGVFFSTMKEENPPISARAQRFFLFKSIPLLRLGKS